MIQQSKTVRILVTLVLIALLWVVFVLIRGIFERKISNHDDYIPENATSVLEIKSEELIRSFLEDVLLAGSLDERFNEFVRTTDDSVEPLGIDYLANCYIFTLQEENNAFTGILVNVLDEDQLRKVMDSETDEGFGYHVRDGIGLLIFQTQGIRKNALALNARAETLISSPTKFNRALLKPTSPDAQINFWSKKYVFNEHKTFQDVHLSLTLQRNELSAKGTATFESSERRSYPILKPSDLSIQTQFIPNQVNELWMKNMRNLGFSFPKLTYVSGNYHYSEPSPVKEMKVLPNFEGIYAFEENFQIQIPLIALAASKKIHSLNLESFKLGDKLVYYKQIDPKTIYLGQSKYTPSSNQKNALFEINGDLKQLLEIRNGGVVERFLKFSPEYNAAERFLSNVQHSNFYIKEADGSQVDILGEISFEEGKSALNELIVLLMGLGLF